MQLLLLPFKKLKAFLGWIWHFVKFLLTSPRPDRFEVTRTYTKLQLLTIFRPGYRRPVKLGPLRAAYPDIRLLKELYHEIFLADIYRAQGKDPSLIIDAGANIGMSMLFFARHYPQARIICFEPDPTTFKFLEENIRLNNLEKVEAHQVAVADQDGELTFYYDESYEGDTGQSVSREVKASDEHGVHHLKSHTLPAVSLRPYVAQGVDLLKLDVEGSEQLALRGIKDLLGQVAETQMEFHFDAKLNRLDSMLALFEEAGHTYRVVAPDGVENVPGSLCMIYSRQGG